MLTLSVFTKVSSERHTQARPIGRFHTRHDVALRRARQASKLVAHTPFLRFSAVAGASL
jgi:hypothetical protein